MPIARGTHYVYTVRPGDTLYSIAAAHSISVPIIVGENALYSPFVDPNLIYPGQVLLVRVPGMTEHSTVLYAIQPGDTLYHLAMRFYTTPETILRMNPLITDPNSLRVAQIIVLPAYAFEVAPGDTLVRIAAQAGVPVGAIVEANRGRPGFSPDVIYPGYRLIIPHTGM